MNDLRIPAQRAPIVNEQREVDREWFRFLSELQESNLNTEVLLWISVE